MRVATSLQFDRLRDRMGALSNKADALNNQLSSTKRITTPSDDAAGYRALTALKRAGANSDAELTNVNLATSLLDSSATALASIESQLSRVKTIAISAGSSTLSDEQRKSLSAEVDVILEDLVRVANTTDARGTPLFSGDSTATPYVVDGGGKVTFTGKGEAGQVPIGDGRTIAATTSGQNIFGNIPVKAGGPPSDMFAIVKAFSDKLKSGAPATDDTVDIQAAMTSVVNAQTSIGARGARLELEKGRLEDLALTREADRSAIEDADIPATITELKKVMTVLDATQASFGKLTSLSLFNYLR
ncbi:flagellar hook-associated protein FlgL [uncultured Sphingomonas sp.]|uniref:flagellar hook-associated protein FlgL n=1 Tax=uncultured Sphingomonas sp. TaxID=158754 RepID=UPI0025D99DC5|nr:flagellar hook-associated protein FlgL [uncultured Sphingomonas sp.]